MKQLDKSITQKKRVLARMEALDALQPDELQLPRGVQTLIAKEELQKIINCKKQLVEIEAVNNLQLSRKLNTEASTMPVFTELVKERLNEGHQNSSSKASTCPQCLQQFTSERLLSKHLQRAHQDDIAHVHKKIAGKYACRICAKEELSRYGLQKHVYLKHSEVDVRARYGCSLAKFVGLL